MLKESEKRGIAELLERMEASDLTSLAQTVTNRLILPQSSTEAIQGDDKLRFNRALTIVNHL